MSDAPGFFARLWLAWVLFFRVLFDATTAARVSASLGGRPERLPEPAKPEPAPAPAPKTSPAPAPRPDGSPALHLLSILQREGRFVDFLQEDIASLSDEQVGAAARMVQSGCKKAFEGVVRFEPVRTEEEGAAVTLEPGFDAQRVRLTGRVVGQAPYKGRLAHHGWRAADVRWPAAPEGLDPTIVAPAEVEIE